MKYMLSMDGFWSSRTAKVIGYAMWVPVGAAIIVLVDSTARLVGLV